LIALGSVVFALCFSWPLLGHLREFGAFHDWDLFTSLAWDPYHTLVHFHQIPLWDPYKCGGIPEIGEPQTRIVNPFFVLYLIFGVVTGMHLEIILHLALAFSGGYLLGRLMGLRPLAALATAAIFPSTSWFYLHAAEGHHTFLAAAYFPWIAATFWLSVDRRSWTASVATGLIVALTFLAGVVYTAIWAGLIVLTLAIGLALTRLSLRPLVSGFIVAISGAGFAAIKLLPALEMFRKYPRLGLSGEYNPWWIFPQLVFARDQDILRQGIWSFGFHEYGAYISIPFVLLALIGVFGSRLSSLPWILLAALFLALYRGDTGPYSIWGLLRRFPFFGGLNGMRLPARSLIGLVFSVAVLAGLGSEVLCSTMGRWGSIVVIALLLGGLGDAWWLGPPNLEHIFTVSQPVIVKSLKFRQQAAIGARFNMTHTAQANMGVLACYEYVDIKTNAKGYDESDYKGEEYLLGPGRVQLTHWTPNTLSFNVIAFAPTVLIVNQNYDDGWRLAHGVGEVFSNDGLIGVRLPAGKQHLVLTYVSNSFRLGVAIGLLALVAMLVLLRYEQQRRRTFKNEAAGV
jgi:hypothetical protein